MLAFQKLNEETYYWLGVLFADGNGTQWNRIILKSKDYTFIKAFADYVGHDVIEGMGARSTVYRVDFSDSEMRNRLIELGWTKEKKAHRRIAYHPIAEDMWRHFIRGYFDGDGSIHKDHRKPNGWRLEIATHKGFTEDLKQVMKAYCPKANIRVYDRKTSQRLMIYNFEGVTEVLRWLYKSATVCPHPKIKADSVKSLIEGIL